VHNDRRTLEETVAMLEAALESTHDAIVVVDLNRRIIRYNSRYLKTFGFTAEELEQGGADFVDEKLGPQLEDREAVLEQSRRLWDNPAAESVDTIRYKDGRVFERFISPHRIGSKIAGRVASFRDISQAVKAEQALDQSRALLEKAQEIAHLGSWVAELDGSGRLAWSRETHRIFGVPDGEFAGLDNAFFSFVHPDDRAAVQHAIDDALGGKQPLAYEYRIVRADGRVRWVHGRADIVRDARGQPLRMIGTVQDITDSRQIEERRRQSQKMEAVGRLAGGVAHDLNNALTTIAGYSELALGGLSIDHPARADVEQVRRAAERATAVTRQLLAFSRKQVLKPRVFSVSDALANLAHLLERTMGADIELRVRMGENVELINADPGQIEQAIVNLALNARDAMPGGGLLEVATSMADVDDAFAREHVPMPPGRYVVVSVSDTGHGMSAETQAQIFEPFFTTKDIGKGTGLGLSMVYGTVKQSGGFIFVESALDRGTRLRLYFPPIATPPPLAAARSGGEAAAPEVPPPNIVTLLVVEDEPAVRSLVAATLKTEGYRLLLAASAEEAMVIAAEHAGPIDLLLTDAVMPGKSGIELANALVAERPGLPVIVMSGYTRETLDVTGLTHAVVLVHKPFTPRELRQRIRELLDR
jgi:two-component system, cell cycle sensor histidine kinase and response regulator CckA